MRSLSRDEVRSIDVRAAEDFGIPTCLLMENAGRNAAHLLAELYPRTDDRPIIVVCGKGNNGGDGLVLARHLEAWGYPVQLLLTTPLETFSGDASLNAHIIQRAATPYRVLQNASADEWHTALTPAGVIVDALLGTGTKGTIQPPLATIITTINAIGRPIFALDLPSGLDCDTGLPLGVCIQATHTATFVARKQGFDHPHATHWTGTIHVLDIGVPRALLDLYRELTATPNL